MRGELIGIISEGTEDQGILQTILKAFGFDGSEVRFIRPELSRDATDRHDNTKTIGTLQGIKNSCLGKDGNRPDFEMAFLTGVKNIIIQADTAEIEQQDFNIIRPKKVQNPNYSSDLRNIFIATINDWLDNKYKDCLLYAISIEEIESWCLTAFEKKDTIDIIDSKGKLKRHLNRMNLTYAKLKLDPGKDKREYFSAIMRKKNFHKIKNLKEYCKYNQSLDDFISSLEKIFFVDN